MSEVADVKLTRNGENIVINPLTPKGAATVGNIFEIPNLTTNAVVETDMHLFELLTRLTGCVIGMVDDEDPSQIYYIDDATRHLH